MRPHVSEFYEPDEDEGLVAYSVHGNATVVVNVFVTDGSADTIAAAVEAAISRATNGGDGKFRVGRK